MTKKPTSKQPIPAKKPTKAVTKKPDAAAKKTTKAKATTGAVPVKTEIRIPAGKSPVLHVGCGAYNPKKLPEIFRGEQWQEIRLDIDPSVKPDIVASMTDMSMLPENSMGAVFSSHNIEHLYPHQVQGALKEFLRVLRPGGLLLITLPDIQTVAAYVAEGLLEEPLYESPAGPISPVDILYGFRKSMEAGNLFMAHKMGFSARSFAQHLLDAGFANVEVRRDWVNLWGRGYKLPEGSPQRKNQAVIVNGSLDAVSRGRPTPEWYRRRLLLEENPESKNDELDVKPVHWKPLGLKR